MDESTVWSITNPEFMAKIPQLMKGLTCLTHSGQHLEAWSNQLKLMIHNLTGIPNYLDQHAPPIIDKKVDQLVLSMILWSIDETLQTRVDVCSTAYEAFCSLVHQFSAPHHQSDPISFANNRQDPAKSVPSRNLDQSNIYPKLSEFISARPADNTAKTRLMSLPNDILDRVIQLVRAIATTESETNTYARWPRIVVLNSNNVPQYSDSYLMVSDHICSWVDPPSQNTAPILNSLQSLAAVNQRLHQLCLPWLWKELIFPTLTPRLPTLYIDIICRKYGRLVRSVTVELSHAWTKHYSAAPIDHLRDNLIQEQPGHEEIGPDNQLPRSYIGTQCGLSPGNLNKILVQCPSLHTLKLTLPRMPTPPSPAQIAYLTTRVLDLVTRFSQLRHFELYRENHEDFPESCVLRMLEHLPLLETFVCDSQMMGESVLPIEEPGWGQTVSQLKNLTRLTLRRVCFVWPTWYTSHTWPKIITHLTLIECTTVKLHDIHQLVHCIAPNVIQLRVEVSDPPEPTEPEVNDPPAPTNLVVNDPLETTEPFQHWNQSQESSFDLPKLKHLEITAHPFFMLIDRFDRCKSLEHLEYQFFPDNHWSLFSEKILNSTWPELKSISLPNMIPYDPADWNFVEIHYSFQKYCRENGIELNAIFM